jgi:cellulose synthase/poly-beta-1,6-N-acetylglucosamine synthase-like glycosyltransferase
MAIAIVIEVLLGAAALLVVSFATVLLVEIASAIVLSESAASTDGERRSVAVLIPAHNESRLIAETIRSVAPQLGSGDRLIVVADNCSDHTAAIAAAEGAEVVVRTDPVRRGKGYALDRGVRHLESSPPDVILILDADCQAGPRTVDLLVRSCCQSGRPIQAMYLMQTESGAESTTRIAEFAWLVKNKVRPIGLHRLGLPCQLMGTGMAFPWASLAQANLATGHIVEDLKLGLELARAGSAPMLCPQALVTSNFPTSGEGIAAQRTRWEHGHLSVISIDALRLLLDGVRSRRLELLALALDLSVPPIALLALSITAIWVSSAILFYFTAAVWPVALASLAGLEMAAAVLASWQVYGREILSLSNLSLSVIYAVRKIPMYLRYLIARQVDWVRSKRD